jgi:hypothetical protein
MKPYRAKPIVIEAVQWIDGNQDAVCAFVPKEFRHNKVNEQAGIKTDNGIAFLNYGDWIIKGTRGEFYPCRDDVFQTKYEPVEDV